MIPSFSFKLPWFMWDLQNNQLITSPTVPGDISDVKNVVLTETPIPGLNYAPIQSAGNMNRKISFTLPIINRNNTTGTSLTIQQFALLRNQYSTPLTIQNRQFVANPKVLYMWGTGSIPLVYYVSKCNFTNKSNWFNEFGNPKYTMVDIELILDETDPVYKAEEMYRQVSAYTGSISGGIAALLPKEIRPRQF